MEYEKLLIELIGKVTVLEKRVETLEANENKVTSERLNKIKSSSKYRNLSSFLKESGKNEIQLNFTQIEEILGFELPNSATEHRPFWANTETHSFALSWLSVGYKTVEVDMEHQTVKFAKVSL